MVNQVWSCRLSHVWWCGYSQSWTEKASKRSKVMTRRYSQWTRRNCPGENHCSWWLVAKDFSWTTIVAVS